MSSTTKIGQIKSGGRDADATGARVIALSEIDNATLVEGFELWRSLCDGRRFPSRSDVTPRMLKPLLRNTALVRVIDGGRDYEFRIVGDAYVMAHGVSFQGQAWSQLAAMSPGIYAHIKPICDQVVQSGEPMATCGWIERSADSSGQVYCEYLYLPLGSQDDVVDHLLIFAVYIRRDGVDHVRSFFKGGNPGH